MKKLKRRSLIRIVSYVSAALLIAVGFAISGYATACDYRIELDNTYQRALMNLSSEVSDIDSLLIKSKYASTPVMLGTVAMEIRQSAAAAKSDLNMLPITEASLDNVNKFLSQVGEYALYISKNVAEGKGITDEESDNIDSLSKMAGEVNKGLNELIASIADKSIMLCEVSNKTNGYLAGINNSGVGISDGFSDIESGFEGYPTLIYDGPYSDGTVDRESEMLKHEAEITTERGRRIAAVALEINESEIESESRSDGVIPSYQYFAEGKFAEITKNGGHLLTLTDSVEVAEEKLNIQQAKTSAEEFLVTMGYADMKVTYSMTEFGICTFNFAYFDNGTICYPDLIKVGVSLEDGKVTTFDARAYITNHKERNLTEPQKSVTEAESLLVKGLNVLQSRRVVIPTDGAEERYCWEIICKAADGTKIIEYFNCDTLREEDILILLEDENGSLTV